MEVTTLAIEKLREVLEDQGEQESSLRVIAIPAETGGLQYMLTMENESQADDTVLNMEGVRFLMDSDSAPFLEEATIDYVENFGGQVASSSITRCSPKPAAAAGADVAAAAVAEQAAAAATRPNSHARDAQRPRHSRGLSSYRRGSRSP